MLLESIWIRQVIAIPLEYGIDRRDVNRTSKVVRDDPQADPHAPSGRGTARCQSSTTTRPRVRTVRTGLMPKR